MFVIHGHSGSLSAIVATASAQKAVFHLKRMTQSGLHAVIRNEDGLICSPRALLPGRAHMAQTGRAFD